MSEENAAPVVDSTANPVAEQPAPDQAATAAPDSQVVAPEANEGEAKPEKVFTQAELDAIVQKRLDRDRRKWEREQRLKATEVPAQVPTQPVVREQFQSDDAYLDARAVQKAAELLATQQAQRQQQELLAAHHEREEEARTKYDDFEQVAYNPKLPITDVMANTIHESDVGPDIAYYLGTNPKEAHRISQLTPFAQAKEIGKIEAKLADSPPVKKTSSAPAPISPVKPRGSDSPAYDTTDPRSIKSMSTSEWIAAERARQVKKLEAQRNR